MSLGCHGSQRNHKHLTAKEIAEEASGERSLSVNFLWDIVDSAVCAVPDQ